MIQQLLQEVQAAVGATFETTSIPVSFQLATQMLLKQHGIALADYSRGRIRVSDSDRLRATKSTNDLT